MRLFRQLLEYWVLFGICVACIAGMSLLARDSAPNFSRTWVSNEDKSDPPVTGSGDQLGSFGSGSLFTEAPESSVKITQTTAEAVLEGPRGGRVVYKLDGSETRSTGPRGEMVSTSKWQKSTMVTRFRQTLTTLRG